MQLSAGLVEHDGLWVLVHHLGHVSEDVLLGDDPQETSEETQNGIRSFIDPFLSTGESLKRI